MELREYENGDLEDASKPPAPHREGLYYRLVEGREVAGDFSMLLRAGFYDNQAATR